MLNIHYMTKPFWTPNLIITPNIWVELCVNTLPNYWVQVFLQMGAVNVNGTVH